MLYLTVSMSALLLCGKRLRSGTWKVCDKKMKLEHRDFKKENAKEYSVYGKYNRITHS